MNLQMTLKVVTDWQSDVSSQRVPDGWSHDIECALSDVSSSALHDKHWCRGWPQCPCRCLWSGR